MLTRNESHMLSIKSFTEYFFKSLLNFAASSKHDPGMRYSYNKCVQHTVYLLSQQVSICLQHFPDLKQSRTQVFVQTQNF